MPRDHETPQPWIAYRCNSGDYVFARIDAPRIAEETDGRLTYLGEVTSEDFDDELREHLARQLAENAYACLTPAQFFAI